MAGAMIAAYEQRKSIRAMLDYEDLIMGMVKLLSREGVAPWVLYKLDGGLDHILIDEAQDTSPEQWQVVAAIAEEFFAGRVPASSTHHLAVGDEKHRFSFQAPILSSRDAPAFRSAHPRRQALQTVPLNISRRQPCWRPSTLFGIEAARGVSPAVFGRA
jgi:hypothetical protein